jgi:hypothetical protein
MRLEKRIGSGRLEVTTAASRRFAKLRVERWRARRLKTAALQ